MPETPTSLLWQKLGGSDVQTGDAPFDEAVNLTGPPAWILAALSNRARKDVKDLLDDGGRVEDGRVHAVVHVHRAFQLVAHVHKLLRLARRLSIPDSEVTRLLARRARDAERAESRTVLAQQLIEHAPFIESFSQIAPVYQALRRSPTHRPLAEKLRRAWITGSPARVGQLGEDDVLPLMDEATPIRIAAIARLGEIGGKQAIAPLTAASRGFFTSSSVKRAAKAALEQVIERVGTIEAGGLALTDPDGRLSLK